MELIECPECGELTNDTRGDWCKDCDKQGGTHVHEWELSLDTEANLCYCGAIEQADPSDIAEQYRLLGEN